MLRTLDNAMGRPSLAWRDILFTV